MRYALCAAAVRRASPTETVPAVIAPTPRTPHKVSANEVPESMSVDSDACSIVAAGGFAPSPAVPAAVPSSSGAARPAAANDLSIKFLVPVCRGWTPLRSLHVIGVTGVFQSESISDKEGNQERLRGANDRNSHVFRLKVDAKKIFSKHRFRGKRRGKS